MTQSSVTIQVNPESVPSTPSWMGEVAVVAQRLKNTGLLQAIQKRVQFARARFGMYDTIDFVVVLLGYAVSSEPTLLAFYERLAPFAEPYMALFNRSLLPDRSTLSRFLAAINQATVEALRTLFLADLGTRFPFDSPGGLSDRLEKQWWIMDIDATRQAARQRALPRKPGLPAPHRRFDQVCAPGYKGRKRGEVVRTRTTVLQPFTHQWIGTYSGAGNGKYRDELKRALEAVIWYATSFALPLSRIVIRFDGLYGNAAPLTDVLQTGLGVIGRCKEYTLLDLPMVKAALAIGPAETCIHPESQTYRALYDVASVPLTPNGPLVRLIVATHPAASSPPKIGVVRAGTVYELFVTALPSPAFCPKDVVDLYLHRGSFETVLADEDWEQDADRWVSHTACGQEFWQILSQWSWNWRLEFGQQLSPTALRTTEFATAHANEPVLTSEPAPTSEPVLTSEDTSTVVYGPPQWARQSFTGGFPGSAFTLQADGSLLCPAHHLLYPSERRPERAGSLRVVYAARIGDCRTCALRVQCQETSHTKKPRQVSAVYWPTATAPVVASSPDASLRSAPQNVPEPLPRFPLLWQDWPRCQLRRNFLKVLRSETVEIRMGVSLPPEPHLSAMQQVLTRAERAHYRLSWQQRLARNAHPATASSVTLTLHGLPAMFAHLYGFPLLNVA